jgi:hypothetical protein
MFNKLFKPKDDKQLRMYYHMQGAFKSKTDAFKYFFFIEGKDIDEAKRLAETMAEAMNLPDAPPAPPTGMDKAKSMFNEVKVFAAENPKLVDTLLSFGAGALTAFGGVGVGNAIANQEPTQTTINIDTSAEVQQVD